jgi:hypothetical protein
MRKFSKKQYLVAGAAAVIVAAGTGAAYAYWTSTGSGTGSATTGTDQSNIQITDLTTPTDMAPGVAAAPVTFTVTNNGSTSAYVNTVTISLDSITNGDSDTSLPACTTADYTLSNATQSVATELAPGASVDVTGSTATLGFNDSASANQDNCQGATVNLAYASN